MASSPQPSPQEGEGGVPTIVDFAHAQEVASLSPSPLLEERGGERRPFVRIGPLTQKQWDRGEGEQRVQQHRYGSKAQPDLIEDFSRLSIGRYFTNNLRTLSFEVVNHRNCFALIGCKAMPNQFFPIVPALNELAPTAVADALLFGGIGIDIVKAAAIRTDAPATQTANRDLELEHENNDGAKLPIMALQDPRLNFHLIEGTWKTIEEHQTALDAIQFR
jgi:hypothetical protein